MINLGCCLCYNKSLGFHINNQNIITEEEKCFSGMNRIANLLTAGLWAIML